MSEYSHLLFVIGGTMQQVRLGNSGLKISKLTLGCMSFGQPALQGTWTLNEQDSVPLIKQAIDLGMNFWDTANVYGMGSSEEIIGRSR
jgi:aryl-alcohol dehydrogenase-like predicted oxidoreductase